MKQPVNYRCFDFWRSAGRFALGLVIATTLVACGSGSSSDGAADNLNVSFNNVDCTADTVDDIKKAWAYNGMQDFYLFSDQVPVVDPLTFDSADDVVRSVRFEERDPFSNVSNTATSSLFFDEGRSFGLGYGVLRDNNNQPRIALVFAASPFALAGVERGDIILSIDGIDWDDEQLNTNFSARVIGTPDAPSTARWKFQKRDTGAEVEIDITAAEYSINSVLTHDTYTIDSLPSKVGYLAFDVFLNTSRAELDEAFAEFANENIGELVLDLRYNGGGRVSIATHLASLIGNSNLAGETLYQYKYNDAFSSFNRSLNFSSGVGRLNLNRVVILTTGRTASSSEIVIAGLQPYLDVVTIGDTSSGKPYISTPNDLCGERLNIMEAEGFNANDVSVFGGIAATCFALDDLTAEFGLNAAGEFEGFLNAGIDYLKTGQCATTPISFSDASTRNIADKTQMDARPNSLDLTDGVAF